MSRSASSTAPVPPPLSLRVRILELAVETVRTQGAEAVTMRRLAEALGYSPASLYLHYRSKAELLEEVVTAGFAALQEAIESALRRSDADRALAQGAVAYLGFASREPHLYDLMFQGAAGPELRRRLFGRLRAALEAAAGGPGLPLGEERLQRAWRYLHGHVALTRAGLLAPPERQEAPEIVARQALSVAGL